MSDVLIQVDAFGVTGKGLSNLSKADVTKAVTLKIGKDKIKDLDKNNIDKKATVSKNNYDDNII